MKELLKWAENRKGRRDRLEVEYTEACDKVVSILAKNSVESDALAFFINIGKITQDQIIGYFEGITTSMLRLIYGDDYAFKLVFELRRGKYECVISVLKGDIEVGLKDECGGGIVDVVSFAMRLAIWSIQKPRTDPIFLLDEPFKFLSKDRIPLMGEALRKICKDLGLQIIMVSHENELIDVGDSAYQVTINKDVSQVSRIN